jgi:thioredoxin-like negative regulator of GroEL
MKNVRRNDADLIPPSTIENISAEQIPALIASGQPPLVLLVSATWCLGCRLREPLLEKLAIEFGGKLQFRRMECGENRAFIQQYNCEWIPHVLCFNEGQLVCQTTDNLTTYEQQHDWIESFAIEHAGFAPVEQSPAECAFASDSKHAFDTYEAEIKPAEAVWLRQRGEVEKEIGKFRDTLNSQVASGEITEADSESRWHNRWREEFSPALKPHDDEYEAIRGPAEQRYFQSMAAATAAWIASSRT